MGMREDTGRRFKANVDNAVKRRLAAAPGRPAGSVEESAAAPPPMASMYEKIILREGRPSILIQNGSFIPEGEPALRGLLITARSNLERALQAVGRLDVEANQHSRHVGTAWMVAPRVAVTNRHVAKEFALYGHGDFPIRRDIVGRNYAAYIDFKREYQRSDELRFRVQRVLYMSPDDDESADFALLELEESARLPSPIKLGLEKAQPDWAFAAIGYPAFDPGEDDQLAMRDYFGRAYGVKRLAPGFVLDRDTPGWAFAHDATTLGGSSGSVLVALDSSSAIGLHYGGVSGEANYAVRASVLADKLTELGVAFEREEAAAPPPTQVALRAAAPSAGRLEEEGVKSLTHKPEFFVGREGYLRNFLGGKIDIPQPVDSLRAEAAQLEDGSIELKYTHFSVIQRAPRRLPWITAVNIDGRKLSRLPRPKDWYRDGRLAADQQAGNEIYTNSGFSRGHMVRRVDPCWGSDSEAELANRDTFHFTNACPQEQDGFNDKLWGDLEDYILDKADAEDIKINVYTGPVFDDDDPLVGDLPIPLRFWKVVAWRAQGGLRAVGFVLSQAAFVEVEFAGGPYRTDERPLAKIGKMAGFDWPQVLLDADVHKGDVDEASPSPMRSLTELERHFQY
ncbi:MAG: DNA/RNA non-specific endonuclease [Polyangiaceae bacterium]